MSEISNITTEQLRALSPCVLDADFLDRLTACAEGCIADLSPEQFAFEAELLRIRPQVLPSNFQAQMLSSLADTPFALDDKILLFNRPSSAKQTSARRPISQLIRFRAVAAVAIFGAFAAFLIPQEGTQNQKITSQSTPNTHSANIAPAGISQTSDAGVIWRGGNQPHRVMRRTYMDEVISTNAKGEAIRQAKPHVEYIIIPEKID
jgi:hypothetical protein